MSTLHVVTVYFIVVVMLNELQLYFLHELSFNWCLNPHVAFRQKVKGHAKLVYECPHAV